MAAASVMQDGGAVAAAVAAAILLNLRYVAIGVSVAPSLRGRRARRLAEAQLATDESWAIAQDHGRVNRERMLGAGLVLLVAWTGGTTAGVLGGARSAIPPPTASTRCSPRSSSRSSSASSATGAAGRRRWPGR